MPSDLAYYPTTTIDASPTTLPREGEGLVGESRASVVRRYQNALNEQGERLVEIHRKLSDREVELITLRADLAKRDEMVAFLKEQNACLEERVESRIIMTTNLEAKVRNLQANLDGAHRERAQRDETIAKQEESNENLWRDMNKVRASNGELRNERDEARSVLDARNREWSELNRKWSEARDTLTSLRTQLARAEAIEEATRALRDHLRPRGGQRWAADAEAALSRVDAALASPSPRDTAEGEPKCRHCGTRISPENLTCGGCGKWLPHPPSAPSPTPQLLRLLGAVGAALADHRSGHGIGRVAEELSEAAEGCRGEGVRLAILERVAKHVREYDTTAGEAEISQAYHLLKLALAELEATQCPSR